MNLQKTDSVTAPLKPDGMVAGAAANVASAAGQADIGRRPMSQHDAWRCADIPTTMTAAVITQPRVVELQQVPVPEPGPNQLLVRLEGCGVCASNVPPWEGKPWFRYPLSPGQLGHEGWGRIAQAPREDSAVRLAIGERVGFISNHSYAEYDVVDDYSIVELPAALDEQPFPAEPLGCAYNIFTRSGIDVDDTVAIVGVGFLGALLIQMATRIGAQVIALARRDFAVDLATKMGAAETVVMDDHNRIIDEVKRLTRNRFCDVVIEATGKQWPLDLSAELTRERGRLVIAGYHQDGPRQVNMQLWNWRGLDVINAHERDPLIYLEGMRHAVKAIASGLLDPAPLYTHRFGLSELGTALDLAATRPDGFVKALILNQ
jgi:threonine dehydrogenase-like Zn-dependent dehydrogenase